MRMDEGGHRIHALKDFLTHITEIATQLHPDGITVRWLNHHCTPAKLHSTNQISQLVNSNPFEGWSRIGTELHYKILDPMVIQPAQARRLKRPVLAMIITDGEVCRKSKS